MTRENSSPGPWGNPTSPRVSPIFHFPCSPLLPVFFFFNFTRWVATVREKLFFFKVTECSNKSEINILSKLLVKVSKKSVNFIISLPQGLITIVFFRARQFRLKIYINPLIFVTSLPNYSSCVVSENCQFVVREKSWKSQGFFFHPDW